MLVALGIQIISDTLEDLDAFQVANAWSKASKFHFFENANKPNLADEKLIVVAKVLQKK